MFGNCWGVCVFCKWIALLGKSCFRCYLSVPGPLPAKKPPPPAWSPAEHDVGKEVLKAHKEAMANKKKPEVKELTAEERAEAKRAKRRRQKQEKKAQLVAGSGETNAMDTGGEESEMGDATPGPEPSPTPTQMPGPSNVEAEPRPVYRGGEVDTAEGPGEGGGGGEASGPGGRFLCTRCNEKYDRQTDIIFEHDWVGVLRGVCYGCTKDKDKEMDEKAFRKLSKRSWTQLQELRGAQLQRARDLKYKGALAMMQSLAPDLSRGVLKSLTKVAVMRIKAFALNLAAAVCETPQLKASAEKATEEWFANMAKQEADPGFTVSTDGRILKARDIGFLTYLGGPGNLCVSWLCRNIDCGFYGENHNGWAKERSGHDRWACPACGTRYQPWAGRLGKRGNIPAFPAQKCVSYCGPDNVVKAFPMEWPSSASDRWLNQLLEDRAAHQGIIKEPVSFAAETVAAISAKLEKFRPAHFKYHPLLPEIEERLVSFDCTVLREKGFYGGFLDLKEPGLEVYTEHSELVGLLANLIACGQQMSKM